MQRKSLLFLLSYTLFFVQFGSTCGADLDWEDAQRRKTQTTARATANPTPFLQSEEKSVVMEFPDETIVFSYEGENPPYHTGLRNSTVFYIQHTPGIVHAKEKATFEEPAGTDLVRTGIDSVQFEGTYDPVTKTITGSLIIATQGTATDPDGVSTNTLEYLMQGTLTATKTNDKWAGKVVGTAELKQVFADGFSDSTKYNIAWTITGTARP